MTEGSEPCALCVDRRFIILDAMQVAGVQRRWQWARIGPGVSDCPACVQVPPSDSEPAPRPARGGER